MSWWDTIASSVKSAGTAAATNPQTSGGFDWGPIIDIGANIAGNLGSAYLANQGANKAADAQTSANQAAIDLQRQIYTDQVARSEPWRQSGFNALNFLNLWNGLPQVSDGATGSFSTNLDSIGAPILPGYGAGQPVAGHSGGGGPNALLSAAGGIAGNAFGGPIGGIIGGTLGGLVRNGGDNWQTLATQAPGGYDYNAYFAADPGLAAEWSKPDVQALFNGNRDAYAYWHYNKYGQGEGRTLSPLESQTGGAGGSGAQSTPAPSTQADLWTTIKNNPLYTAATQGFLGIDKPTVEGAFSTAGQALSGAKEKALFDRGTSRAYGALSDIYGNYSGMAGVGASTANQQNANAGQFGANAGNLTVANGKIAGDAAVTKNANWMNAAQNALGGAYDVGKSAGWFS